MRIGSKLAIAFFMIAFLSMLVIGMISYFRAKHALHKQSFDKLTAFRELKAGQIEDYFELINDQILTMAESPMVIEAMKELETGFNKIEEDIKLTDAEYEDVKKRGDDYITKEFLPKLNKNIYPKATLADEVDYDKKCVLLTDLYYVKNPNPPGEKNNLMSSNDPSSYSASHAKFHSIFKSFADKFGYYDIFLIDTQTGNIVYTVYKELDFATSLTKGPFKNTNLAAAYNAVTKSGKKNFVKLVDYMPYHPSYNAPSSFIACSIFDGDKEIGVLAFQMPIDKINAIMTDKENWENVGLGKTGETYIVGDDFKIRNQSRFLIEDSTNYFRMLEDLGEDKKVIEEIKNYNSSIGLQSVKTPGTKEALSGTTDAKIFPDYRGVSVLSAYKPLKIGDMHWALMSEMDEAEAFDQVDILRNNIIVGFLCLLVVVFVVSYFVSRAITRPLNELTREALELADGNLEVEIQTGRKDEIGILAFSFKKMQASISKLINDLKDINHNLEDKVKERTAEVMKQKDVIEEKQKEIVDSIHYAKRIQTTILPSNEFLGKNLSDFFVLFKPQSIVSGDFYWATRVIKKMEDEVVSEKFYLAVCDSTGHGVPGAFMSILNISFLNEAINEKNIEEPNEILNYVRKRLIKNLSHEGGQDGMDGAVICFDKTNNTISYASAHNAPIIVRDKNIIEYTADKMPVGKGIKTDSFTLQKMDVKKGDVLYFYTDGYADQFGGPKGKKFKYKTLNALLLDNSHLSLTEQSKILLETFNDWKGHLEQIDDVCVFAVRV
ncbi:MAG: SpoIIE family protein phosphatase [Bacteroidetes bacterium]|nr:SpoIIE family protein phosphatase [Bacteroidota bacterium]